ncbi:MAG: ClpXP protease specificity-enhancing factor SspB [Alphaproteobacteria bacterium]|jgi:hypothetical protein|nr:ClpXP protease specificity-enhancing factor SspB [Alphaproteobacteria bacterium]
MVKDPFDFTTWIAESVSLASLEVIKKAINTLAKIGKSATKSVYKHSFYISFVTQDKEVVLPEFLKESYPDTITIVLENQFENLKVAENGFFVSLSFNNKLHDLYVPFKAIINFSDRSLNLNIPIMYDSKRLNEKAIKSKKTKGKTKKSTDTSNVIEFKRD